MERGRERRREQDRGKATKHELREEEEGGETGYKEPILREEGGETTRKVVKGRRRKRRKLQKEKI